MFVKFSEKAQKALVVAESCAYQFSSQEVTTEHLLFALLKMPDLSFTKCLKKYMVTDKKIVEIIKEKGVDQTPVYIEYSDELRLVIENAMKQAVSKKVTADLFGLVLLQQDTLAKTLLESYGVDLIYVKQFLKERKENSLKQISELVNLNEKVRKKEIKVIGREQELELLMEMLCRKEKNNAIIIGDAGVGKTALVEKLACALNEVDCHHPLYKKIIYELDLPSVLAGTKYRGDFEEKLKKIIIALKLDPNAIVFIDEIHNLVDAGKAEGAIDASNILKPYLARGEISCIGATTYLEYKKHFENDPALNRRFAKIELKEENDESIFKVLKGLKEGYEKFHLVNISDDILRKIIHLTSTYMKDRYQPDKALDVLDLCCVKTKMEGRTYITSTTVEEIVERLCGFKFSQNISWDVLKSQLTQSNPNNIGSIDLLIEGLKSKKTSFLLVGNRQVNLAVKKIADFSNKHFVQFHMNEYNDPYALSRLLGVNEHYQKTKSLLDEVKHYPESVILFDEIQSAHFSVLHFLSKLLQDKEYNHISFEYVIFMFVSKRQNKNAGFKKIDKADIVFPGINFDCEEVICFF